MANTNRYSTTRIAFIGVMAAIIVVVTFFRFPLLGSKVHFANAMCLLAGLLLGPVGGGLAAGIGSFLYDILFGGYDVVQGCITFVSKFSMAWICAMLALYHQTGPKPLRVILASVAGALAYVVLYMLKTFVTRHLCMVIRWMRCGSPCFPSFPHRCSMLWPPWLPRRFCSLRCIPFCTDYSHSRLSNRSGMISRNRGCRFLDFCLLFSQPSTFFL